MRLYIQQAQQVQKVQNIFSTGKKGIVHETKYLTLTLTIQQVIQRKFFFNRYWRLKKFFNRHFRIIPNMFSLHINISSVYR